MIYKNNKNKINVWIGTDYNDAYVVWGYCPRCGVERSAYRYGFRMDGPLILCCDNNFTGEIYSCENKILVDLTDVVLIEDEF